MKISAILHKIGRESSNSFARKLEIASSMGSDIIIGPYSSLRSNKDKRLSSRREKDDVYRRCSSISQRFKGIILPGTIVYPINEREIVCEAPCFYNGKLLISFWKERENGEGDLAEENDYVYKKGDNSKNKFAFLGKKIAVELCGDHGNQNVRDCNLELILTHDSKAGFWLNASNDAFARKAIVCDGYSPKAEAFDYDPNRSPRIIQITGEKNKSGDIVNFVV
jgi:hypothetical protein